MAQPFTPAAAQTTESNAPSAKRIRRVSLASLKANQANSQLSTGCKSAESGAICSRNAITHGLTRQKDKPFELLAKEDSEEFSLLKDSLLHQHQPANSAESALVNALAQSQWLLERAMRLQESCMNAETGAITNRKFSLYGMYRKRLNREFQNSLQALFKLQSERSTEAAAA